VEAGNCGRTGAVIRGGLREHRPLLTLGASQAAGFYRSPAESGLANPPGGR